MKGKKKWQITRQKTLTALLRVWGEKRSERIWNNSSARKAQDRMIRRMGSGKDNAKVDETKSATDRIPLWSR